MIFLLGFVFFVAGAGAQEQPVVPLLRSSVDSVAHAEPVAEKKPEEEIRARGVHFAFAVPDYDSRISLGVYDSAGRLVRTIVTARPESDFRVGVNGLMGDWDWKDKSGKFVPEGEYFIRGFAVGAFEEKESASQFVTWGDAFGTGLNLREILQLGNGPGGTLIVLARDVDDRAVLLAFNPATEERLWSRTLGLAGGESWILGQPSESVVAVMGKGEIELIDPGSGRVLLRALVEDPGREVHSLRLAPEEVQWVTDAGVRRVSMVDLSPLEPLSGLPGGVVRYSDGGSGRMALDGQGRLWTGEPIWTVFLHDEGAWFQDFAEGREGRFWALVRERRDGEQRLGQFNRRGEFLRQIQPETFEGTPQTFSVGSDESTLFVLSKDADGRDRHLLGIRRKPFEGPSVWETFWEKRVDPAQTWKSAGFRFLPLRMKLEVTSALGRGRETGLFRLLLKSDGVALRSADGLDLGLIWRVEDLSMAAAAASPENPEALLFRGLAEEKMESAEVAGLDRIARVDVGRFVWPPEEDGADDNTAK